MSCQLKHGRSPFLSNFSAGVRLLLNVTVGPIQCELWFVVLFTQVTSGRGLVSSSFSLISACVLKVKKLFLFGRVGTGP